MQDQHTSKTLQTRRRRGLWALQGFIGVSAVVAGAMMLLDPTGALVGLDASWLSTSPFESYLIPGVVLFVVNGLGSLVGAVMTYRGHARAGLAALGLGAFLVAWIVAQLVWLEGASAFQPIYLILGLVEISLGSVLGGAEPQRGSARQIGAS